MSSAVQRSYSRPSLVGSVVNPCPTPTPPSEFGAPLGGDGPPVSDPPNAYVVWTYTDFTTGQVWTWNNETFLWS